MNTELNFSNIKHLSIEGFDPNNYGRPYEENPDESYLPYEIQRWWFNTLYPNGRIMVTKPEPDAEHTPGAYTATATIWKDKNEAEPDICISSRAVPSESTTVDPYQDCQRKAISLALKTLGFWLTPSKVVVKPMVNPDSKDLVEGAIAAAETKTVEVEDVVDATPITTETPEEATIVPKKRGRKPKATEDVDTVTTSKVNVTEATDSEKENEEIPPVEEVTTAPEVAPTETIATVVESDSSESETESTDPLMPLDEARATVLTYRNHSGRTIGELADSGNQKDHELLVWFATSGRAAEKYKAEASAAKAVLANES